MIEANHPVRAALELGSDPLGGRPELALFTSQWNPKDGPAENGQRRVLSDHVRGTHECDDRVVDIDLDSMRIRHYGAAENAAHSPADQAKDN